MDSPGGRGLSMDKIEHYGFIRFSEAIFFICASFTSINTISATFEGLSILIVMLGTALSSIFWCLYVFFRRKSFNMLLDLRNDRKWPEKNKPLCH